MHCDSLNSFRPNSAQINDLKKKKKKKKSAPNKKAINGRKVQSWWWSVGANIQLKAQHFTHSFQSGMFTITNNRLSSLSLTLTRTISMSSTAKSNTKRRSTRWRKVQCSAVVYALPSTERSRNKRRDSLCL